MTRIAALIMAAGASTRFDGCKLLADIGGSCLLQQRIDLAAELFPEDVYVVTGAWHRELVTAKAEKKLTGASFIFADSWGEGLAASLVAGVKHLEREYDAILVLLADQVALARTDLQQLLAAFDGNNIACAVYHGKRGVPAIFGNNSFARLKQLKGDQGAKAVLYESDMTVSECPMPNARWDIDSREQLAAWSGRQMP
ncbi:nucleotidyltransferase family protein [Halovibrio sp. HP20-50]|uniref:nucleotidyltransferase family protein n=1 Tax=Halovibrio sp. HP20-59 TaxID=3080275 RepID=UPI00294B6941|nr:nucleotidyltransferase family protein [Halovibrio sp. HP20-59]MEA2117535.1 nucleotidyltransferase family protein [Halovibrio sp. HP20-59]